MLRGELSAADISNLLREVRSRAGGVPVTYADVWEFWERAKALSNDVDFVTVHILPYWEDLPSPRKKGRRPYRPHPPACGRPVSRQGDSHRRNRLAERRAYAEGALPSPADQALVLHDVLKLARDKGYRVNVIEAFDQPWKRRNEGTEGGHWGLIDSTDRQEKIPVGPSRQEPSPVAGPSRRGYGPRAGSVCLCRLWRASGPCAWWAWDPRGARGSVSRQSRLQAASPSAPPWPHCRWKASAGWGGPAIAR